MNIDFENAIIMEKIETYVNLMDVILKDVIRKNNLTENDYDKIKIVKKQDKQKKDLAWVELNNKRVSPILELNF